MQSILAVFLGSIMIIGLWLYRKYQKKKEAIKSFRNNWGDPKSKSYRWKKIRLYHDHLKSTSGYKGIDDETWDDLNFGEIYKKIDHTVSPVGQQVLFNMLHSPLFNDSELERRKQFPEVFKDEDFRINLQMELNKLNDVEVWRLPKLLYEELPDIPCWYNGLLAIPFLAVSCIILGFINPIFFISLGIFPVVNMAVQYIVGNRVRRYTLALSGISPLLSQAEAIAQLDHKNSNPLGKLGDNVRQQTTRLAKLKRRVHTYLHEGNQGSLGAMLWDYLNILFLIKINMFTLSVKTISKNKGTLKKLYYNIGYLDSMLSVASFKSSLSGYCHPEFTETDSHLGYSGAYHPLLDEAVANSIKVGEKGILITGSNMSGKTTFLKTLGVNQVLAQTLNFCFAEEATLSFCNVISSMRREDNLQEGKSFYLGEVDRVKELIDSAADSGNSNLFLLDEIFRGTNTIERISASRGVLKWLKQKSNFVLASTHDLELVDLLSKEYEFYHFRETVHGQTMSFDYKLKEGHSSTRNAIRLLDINDYPDKVITDAMELADTLEEQGTVNFSNRN